MTLTLDDGRCAECLADLPPPKPTGRPRVFCSDRCQRRHDKRRANGTEILRYSERTT